MFHKLKENIYPAYVSKHNSNREKQVILLMIQNEGWHYLAVKKLSASLRGISSKYHGDFYCCFHFFATENRHESHKNVYKRFL